MNFDTMAARGLNNAWVTHKPTYAGLRLLLSSVKDSGRILGEYIPRRLKTRGSWRYYGFQITKDINSDGVPNYRNCIVGSPLTLLAEAFILDSMAKEKAFAVPACAYSYKWPEHAENGRNFEYYFDGYQQRNDDVAELLDVNKNAVAVVLDLKQFYPTIDKARLRKRLEDRLHTVFDKTRRELLGQFIFGMLELESPKTSHGIPIGPDLSHVLGHVALTNVDFEMAKKYGTRYLRYVDDFIVVCEKAEVEAVLSHLKGLLDAEGLKLNDDKRDDVGYITWKEHGTSASRQETPDVSFEELTARIIRFLIDQPVQSDHLIEAFFKDGFSIPIGRLHALSKSSRYQSFLGLRYLAHWLIDKLTGSTDSIDDLIKHARNVRLYYQSQLDQIASTKLVAPSMRRRWQVQHWRRILGRLVYLQEMSTYKQLLSKVPDIGELAEVRAVLRAITSGDCSNLMSVPGRAISTFAQIWQTCTDVPPKVQWAGVKKERPEAGAACDLSLMLSANIPDEFAKGLQPAYQGTALLVDICRHNPKPEVRPKPQSYLDELSLLFRGQGIEVISGLFTSRHDERENLGFEALGLSGGLSGPQEIVLPYRH